MNKEKRKEEKKGEAPTKKDKRGEERKMKRQKERSSGDIPIPEKERKMRKSEK